MNETSNQDIIAAVLASIRGYQPGRSRGALLVSDDALARATADEGFRVGLEAGLIGLLGERLDRAAREHVCRQLAVIGTEASVPGLMGALSDLELVTAACAALDAIPGRAVAAAAREALGNAQGAVKLALIDLLGRRRDKRSVGVLSGLATEGEDVLAAAAWAALGAIGTDAAAVALRRAGSRRSGKPPVAYVDACLVCAERLGEDSRARQRLLESLKAK